MYLRKIISQTQKLLRIFVSQKITIMTKKLNFLGFLCSMLEVKFTDRYTCPGSTIEHKKLFS